MGNFGKFILGLLIVGLMSLFGAWQAHQRSDLMSKDIKSALSAQGHDWAASESSMSGNVFKLGGIAPDANARAGAIKVASETSCSTCKKSKDDTPAIWHEVSDKTTLKPAPKIDVVSPYTLSGQKTEDGRLVLNGYVKSQEEKQSILDEARAMFPAGVTDRTLKIAAGQPNEKWRGVASLNMKELAELDYGRFIMEDYESNITGQAASDDVRQTINTMVGGLPTGYNGSANVTVPGTIADTAGQSNSQAICQQLVDDLNARGDINFASASAAIRGQVNQTLLNDLASGVAQCPTFRVSVEGHTDSEGQAAYNLDLSKRRAASVMAYLKDKGIDAGRLSSQGFGETKPIANNATAEGKAQNRRIEFVVSRTQ